MVRCSRPLTTYPARANRSKVRFRHKIDEIRESRNFVLKLDARYQASALTYSLANEEIRKHGWQRPWDCRLRVGGEERLVLEVGGEFLDVEGPVESSA
jgi:hypothetical protein